jgi:hypothetical protein
MRLDDTQLPSSPAEMLPRGQFVQQLSSSPIDLILV